MRPILPLPMTITLARRETPAEESILLDPGDANEHKTPTDLVTSIDLDRIDDMERHSLLARGPQRHRLSPCVPTEIERKVSQVTFAKCRMYGHPEI